MIHTSSRRGSDRSPGHGAGLSLAPLLVSASLLAGACSSGSGSGGPSGAALAVTPPPGGLSVEGPAGGPFEPSSLDLVVENASAGPVDWTASTTEPWVGLSEGGGAPAASVQGTLAAGDQTTVLLSIDQEEAAALSTGSFSAAVTFTNETGGAGETFSVELRVSGPFLEVDPATGFSVGGPTGGPFGIGGSSGPQSQDFALENSGDEPLDWEVFTTESWLEFSSLSGTLAAGASTALTVSIGQQELSTFSAGNFPAVIEFTNETNGAGDTSRAVQLTVQSTGQTLLVDPDEAFDVTGPPGGPFTPATKVYEVTNVDPSSVAWSAVPSVPWMQASPSSGTLAPGESAEVELSLDQTRAAGLGPGTFGGRVDLRDETNGTQERIGLGLTVRIASGTLVDAISQFGVTWTFDREVPAGQFVNGDYWVQGPVSVVSIEPGTRVLQTPAGNRVLDGSVVNPSPRDVGQGYDSEMFGKYKGFGAYNPTLTVGLDVSPSDPLVLQPDSSLVTTISKEEAGVRPQLRTAAILTVLEEKAAPGDFRPPYCGKVKTVRWNEDDLDLSKLRRLAPVSSTPPLRRVEDWFERPWLDHVPDWIGRYHHPSDNMPDYGREMCDRVGTAALMLHLDFTDEEKRTLLVRFVQLGLDLWGIVQDGGENNWPAGGGHHSGRKWPILFAGLMLDDPDMSGIGFDPTVAFNEDDQTFYVRETSAGVYNNGYGGYGPQHEGLPEWGNQHAKNLGQDDVRWFGNAYRICCTANVWWGEVLAAHVMEARTLWNHDALFDYMDRYRKVAPTTGQAGWTISWSPFPLEMWDAYRDDYP